MVNKDLVPIQLTILKSQKRALKQIAHKKGTDVSKLSRTLWDQEIKNCAKAPIR